MHIAACKQAVDVLRTRHSHPSDYDYLSRADASDVDIACLRYAENSPVPRTPREWHFHSDSRESGGKDKNPIMMVELWHVFYPFN